MESLREVTFVFPSGGERALPAGAAAGPKWAGWIKDSITWWGWWEDNGVLTY